MSIYYSQMNTRMPVNTTKKTDYGEDKRAKRERKRDQKGVEY